MSDDTFIRVVGWGPFRLPGERRRRRRAAELVEQRERSLRLRSTESLPTTARGATSRSERKDGSPETPKLSADHSSTTAGIVSAGEKGLAPSQSVNASPTSVGQDQHESALDEDSLRSTFERRQRILGEHHPDTLTALHSLADYLARQGADAKAEKEFRSLVEIRKRQLGEEHQDTLAARQSLAVVLANQRKAADAEVEFRFVSEALKRKLGEEHPDTLAARYGLAVVLANQRKDVDAEAEFESVKDANRRADEVTPAEAGAAQIPTRPRVFTGNRLARNARNNLYLSRLHRE